jgi:cephalosporin-C deacetylase
MLTDLTLDELANVIPVQVEPDDFDSFWTRTLTEARSHSLDVMVERVTSPIETIDLFDVTFSGFNGQRVRAWLRIPHGAKAPLPCIAEFVGYGGGRGLAEDNLFWASAGFAHLHMDTRGQGSTWSIGVTPDDASSGPRIPGMMTNGIQSPDDYYYRRLMTDAVRAVEAVASLPEIDESRITVLGASQGGGLALAVAGLSTVVDSLVAYVPFLCDFPRAILITDSDPYNEISRYLKVHRTEEANVLRTLSYFDGVNFARRAHAKAWFTTSLMDPVCPPSTVHGAYQAYAGPKEIKVWTHNGHEGGGRHDDLRLAPLLKARAGVRTH